MKILSGKIISKKMTKTATVEVVRFVAHPLYKKRMKRTKLYQVHDENDHALNEIVNFVPCRPYSKTKKWKIVEKNVVADTEVKKTKEVKSKKEVVKKERSSKKKA